MELDSHGDPVTEIVLLNRDEVASLVDLHAMLDGLERGFVAISAGRADIPPRPGAQTQHSGILEAMSACVDGTLASKLIAVYPDNEAIGYPRHQGVVVLFDERTGAPLAILDAREVTALRTALTTIVATKHLANPDSEILTVVGPGVQGREHLRLAPMFHRYREIRVVARNLGRARAASEPIGAVAMDSVEEGVRDADVVCLCSFSQAPIVRREWFKPGAHINSIGFWHELDTETVTSCQVFVESRDTLRPPPDGAHEVQGMPPEALTELGEVISGDKPGRTAAEQVTVYKGVGTAAEDAVMAQAIYAEALIRKVGTRWRP